MQSGVVAAGTTMTLVGQSRQEVQSTIQPDPIYFIYMFYYLSPSFSINNVEALEEHRAVVPLLFERLRELLYRNLNPQAKFLSP